MVFPSLMIYNGSSVKRMFHSSLDKNFFPYHYDYLCVPIGYEYFCCSRSSKNALQKTNHSFRGFSSRETNKHFCIIHAIYFVYCDIRIDDELIFCMVIKWIAVYVLSISKEKLLLVRFLSCTYGYLNFWMYRFVLRLELNLVISVFYIFYSYTVSVGIVDKLTRYCKSVRDPIDNDVSAAQFLLSTVELLTTLTVR